MVADKHDNHGGNVQVITAPDGWPLWTSPVRPGREHDTTALHEHPEILPLLTMWTAEHLRVLGDLCYEGERETITTAFKKPAGNELPDLTKPTTRSTMGSGPSVNAGNSLLKMTVQGHAQRQPLPMAIGKIVAAAPVLLHIEQDAPHEHSTQSTRCTKGSLPLADVLTRQAFKISRH